MKWDNILADLITLNCRVRPGCVLSPVLFDVYVNNIIERLSEPNMGAELGIRTCHASRMQMTLFNFSIPG